MNHSNCNDQNEYVGTCEGAYYTGDAVFAKTAATNGNCGSTAATVAAGTAGSHGGTGRICNLYWQGYVAGLYANNRCNQSAETRTATQTADRTTAASNCRCPCSSCNNCGNRSNCGNCGNCHS